MAFHDEHSPSIPAKVVIPAGVLAGTLLPAILMSGYVDGLSDLLKYERVQGNSWRQIIILSCSLVYFIRLIIGLFVFLNRKISWFEGGLVSFLFFLMFYLFGVSAGSHPEPIGLLDIVGIFLFLAGSTINTLAEYQRFVWKRKTENQGRLYTRGLFKYSMHINYFGDSVCYVGLALITLELGYLMVPIVIILNFIVLQIPLLDDHLSRKYENEFREYAKRTKKFVPFIY
jgi:protein-S-isoprenylcysteine O-methyltransferase Ste14